MHAPRIAAAALVVVAVLASGAPAAGQEPAPAQPVVVRVEDGGFDWEDAGLGAAAGVAASLVVVGLVVAVSSVREEER
jgi:hypothetical protein